MLGFFFLLWCLFTRSLLRIRQIAISRSDQTPSHTGRVRSSTPASPYSFRMFWNEVEKRCEVQYPPSCSFVHGETLIGWRGKPPELVCLYNLNKLLFTKSSPLPRSAGCHTANLRDKSTSTCKLALIPVLFFTPGETKPLGVGRRPATSAQLHSTVSLLGRL